MQQELTLTTQILMEMDNQIHQMHSPMTRAMVNFQIKMAMVFQMPMTLIIKHQYRAMVMETHLIVAASPTQGNQIHQDQGGQNQVDQIQEYRAAQENQGQGQGKSLYQEHHQMNLLTRVALHHQLKCPHYCHSLLTFFAANIAEATKMYKVLTKVLLKRQKLNT
tara:strand:- start:77 stop:568 length:492 start_codon:yes stop_codon:yes gene_type:complete